MIIDNNIDLCCQHAFDTLDLELGIQACVTDSIESDEFFTFDEETMICTITFDRETKFFLHADTMMTSSLYDHMEYCVVNTVDRD